LEDCITNLRLKVLDFKTTQEACLKAAMPLICKLSSILNVALCKNISLTPAKKFLGGLKHAYHQEIE